MDNIWYRKDKYLHTSAMMSCLECEGELPTSHIFFFASIIAVSAMCLPILFASRCELIKLCISLMPNCCWILDNCCSVKTS